jgi:hypothetical protein
MIAMGFRKIRLPPVYHKLRIEVQHGLWYITTEIFEVTEKDRLSITIKQKVPEYDEIMRRVNESARTSKPWTHPRNDKGEDDHE